MKKINLDILNEGQKDLPPKWRAFI